MAKNLLIVESPAKAKTIEKYLGSDFEVKSSYGHIRDLDCLHRLDKGKHTRRSILPNGSVKQGNDSSTQNYSIYPHKPGGAARK